MTIFDKTSTESLEHSNAGAGLGIQPIGLRVLQRLNVLDECKVRIENRPVKGGRCELEGSHCVDLSYSDFQESCLASDYTDLSSFTRFVDSSRTNRTSRFDAVWKTKHLRDFICGSEQGK